MKIPTFCKFIEIKELEPYTLKNCTVVIDGQNVLFQTYQCSNLPYKLGCESDKYAAYLRQYFQMFKDANVKCYFIFKGGHKDVMKKIDKKKYSQDDIVNPVFMKDIFKQVLDEMSFEYTISEFESNDDLIAFAQKFDCPVISFNVEFCFSSITYIPHSKHGFKKNNNGIEVGIFKLDNFLRKHNLTIEKLAVFITIADEHIFGYNFFLPLIDNLHSPRSYYTRHQNLLKWLGRVDLQEALGIIHKYVNKDKFQSEMEKAIKFINRKAPEGMPVNHLTNRNTFEIKEKDLDWFKKGVALGHISIQYIDLYHSNIIFGSWAVEDEEAEDSLLFSIGIIKYAHKLLTNTKSEFQFRDKTGKIKTIQNKELISPLQNSDCAELVSSFENGWDHLKNLRLFEHFLEKSLQGFNYDSLQKIPGDARLCMISLVYFSRFQLTETENIACSVIMSYIMLAIVFDKLDKDSCMIYSDSIRPCQPYIDPTTDQSSVTEKDCTIANHILTNYFKVTKTETDVIFDKKRIHPLVEFQHCLAQLNYLNKLCGTPYIPTKYSKTYNGTFVYKLLHAIENNQPAKGTDFVKQLINPAPTVLSFFNGMFDTYLEIMYG